MPTRRNFHRVPTPEVQEPDGWIEVYTISAALGLEFMSMSAQLQDKETIASRPELVHKIAKTALEQVKDWNWVDNDGNPMPKPSAMKRQAPLEFLSLPEVMALISALVGGGTPNSSATSGPSSDSEKVSSEVVQPPPTPST